MSVIKQRIRNKRGKHVGIMVAFKDNCGVHVGWSVCNIKMDRYDKVLGERIAVTRACEGTKVQPPRYALDQIADFGARAMKYFNNPSPKVRVKKQTA